MPIACQSAAGREAAALRPTASGRDGSARRKACFSDTPDALRYTGQRWIAGQTPKGETLVLRCHKRHAYATVTQPRRRESQAGGL